MMSATSNELTVSFPAQSAFTRMGRVSVGGIALRLAVDISLVEELRLAADAATIQLTGLGRITVTAQWSEQDLVVRLENPDASLDDDIVLDEPDRPNVEHIVEPPSRIFLRLPINRGDSGPLPSDDGNYTPTAAGSPAHPDTQTPDEEE